MAEALGVKSSMKHSIAGYGTTLPSLQHEGKGLTSIGAGLSITSTIVGGGMVGLPYAIYLLGVVAGFILLYGAAYTTHWSTYLYFGIQELVPGNYSSIYEMAYVLQGRASIFLIAIVTFFVSSGLMLIYYIVFGTTCA